MILEVDVAFLSLPDNFQKSVCGSASDWSRDRCTTNQKSSLIRHMLVFRSA